MFDIKYSKQAVKFLKSLDKTTATRILKRIEKLKQDPVSHDSKIVEGYREKLFRVRVGDYRILYEVDHNDNLIGIVKIDKRSRVYSH
ncbi:MAG: type II toxin-antitoxin system RelE/ParE family toxin [Methanosarcinaceae archaeon]|nr:type II toxin-antitoxin system RelE/ParE family toxin [Methanosarcinaceae archaeon]